LVRAQAAVGRADQEQLLIEHIPRLQQRAGLGVVDDRQLQLAIEQRLLQKAPKAAVHAHAYLRVTLLDGGHQLAGQQITGTGGHAHAYKAAHHARRRL
jgi:hypothetical protein